MATPLFLYKFNEASSGTAPTALVDSAASPLNAPLFYSTGTAWTTNAGGNALNPGSAATGSVGTAGFLVTGVSKLRSALNGAKQVTYEAQEFITSQMTGTDAVSVLYCDTSGTVDVFGLDRLGSGSLGGGYAIATNTAADGDHETVIVAAAPLGYVVTHAIVDTSLATARRKLFINGFLAGSDNNNVTQNTTFVFSGGAGTERLFGALACPTGAYNEGFAGIYVSALTAADCLSHALRLFASNDNDPNSVGANLRAAGTNGGTNDASTSTADPTAAATQTVGAAGLNRGLIACVTGFAVSTGVTVCTFNGAAGTRIAGGTSTGSSDAEIWWWNDAALPLTANTYSSVVTVDGATGTVAVTLHYDEGVAQTAPTNFIVATGTGTSITGTLPSSATAGSILHGVLFDVTVADTAVAAANQLPLSVVNGTTTGNTHRHTSGAKYIPIAGSNSMSWSGLTTATAKIIVVVEMLASAAPPPTIQPSIIASNLRVALQSVDSTPRYLQQLRMAQNALAAQVTPTPPAVVPTIYGGAPWWIARAPVSFPYYLTQINPSYNTGILPNSNAVMAAAPQAVGAFVGAILVASGFGIAAQATSSFVGAENDSTVFSTTPQANTSQVGAEGATSVVSSTPLASGNVVGAELDIASLAVSPVANNSLVGANTENSSISATPTSSVISSGSAIDASSLVINPNAAVNPVGSEVDTTVISSAPNASGNVNSSGGASANLVSAPQASMSPVGSELETSAIVASPQALSNYSGQNVETTSVTPSPSASTNLVGAETDTTLLVITPQATVISQGVEKATSVVATTPQATLSGLTTGGVSAAITLVPTSLFSPIGSDLETAAISCSPIANTAPIGSLVVAGIITSTPTAVGSLAGAGKSDSLFLGTPTSLFAIAAQGNLSSVLSCIPSSTTSLVPVNSNSSSLAATPSAISGLIGAAMAATRLLVDSLATLDIRQGNGISSKMDSNPTGIPAMVGDLINSCSFASAPESNFALSTQAATAAMFRIQTSSTGAFQGPAHHPTATFVKMIEHSPATSFTRIKP